ncbi:hypothetical protein [Kitasatospora sp. NPDC057198]|uniref:hypothetical protein n=1 Tax=Kitasatospora sp. NPDC057198 TaxID=3346046 RepID=UPI003627785E
MSEVSEAERGPEPEGLYEAFAARTKGTPYTVTRDEGGLLLQLDLADTHWRGFLYEQRISIDYRILLRFDPAARTYTREQRLTELSWRAGVGPGGLQVSASRSSTRGTLVSKQTRRYRTVGPDGVNVAEYRFDSTELTDLVAEVMDGTGWTRRMDPATRLGLTVAGSVLGALVLAGLVVAVVLLL